MTELGHFSLCVGLCLSVYALFVGIFSSVSKNPQALALSLSGRNALVGVNVCVVMASIVLWGALLSHDFSVRYAFRNSAVDMPLVYLFTSFWSSLEGSHLLWTLILSSVSSAFLLTVRKNNAHYLPALVLSTAIPQTFMLLLNVWESAPLARQFPVGQYGTGMNALLQNPYMAIHPPTLFIGYCFLVVPFAYGAAALWRGMISQDWIITVRRWTLAGWAILGVGIFLGGKWAYVELGWAGYWAWDPVENSSFMPWLCATAGLHNLLILDKTRKLPRLTIFLGMLAFSLTFLGTFITRSGVISSVHSFAESNIGPAYLTFVIVLLFYSIVLIAMKGPRLVREEVEDGWQVSKEASLLFTNFFLLFLLALVLVGTLLPLIVEATRGVRISIQQPFFNAFAPWIAVGLVSILGIGNLMKWKTGRIEDPLVSLGYPALWATLITAALAFRKELDPASTIGFWLVIWTMGSLLMDLIYRLKDLRWNSAALWKFNRPYIGAWIAHVGFLVAIAGFLGGYRGLEATTTLDLGESTEFYGYTLTNKGLRATEGSNYTWVHAQIEAKSQSGKTVLIEPIRSKYTNNEEWLNEVGVHSTVWHDLYLILNTFDFKKQQATLRMNVNPTVKLVWASIVIMSLGAIVGLTHRFRRRSLDLNASMPGGDEEMEQNPAQAILHSIRGAASKRKVPEHARSAATNIHINSSNLELSRHSKLSSWGSAIFVAFAIGICLFGLGAVAMGSDQEVIRLDPNLIEIGKELRCPTCQGLSIIDSNSAQSIAMKNEIERQLAAGIPKEKILDYFRERYGEWILREPDSKSGMGLMIWSIPITGLALGPVIMIVLLRMRKKADEDEEQKLREELKAFLNSQRPA